MRDLNSLQSFGEKTNEKAEESIISIGTFGSLLHAANIPQVQVVLMRRQVCQAGAFLRQCYLDERGIHRPAAENK